MHSSRIHTARRLTGCGYIPLAGMGEGYTHPCQRGWGWEVHASWLGGEVLASYRGEGCMHPHWENPPQVWTDCVKMLYFVSWFLRCFCFKIKVIKYRPSHIAHFSDCVIGLATRVHLYWSKSENGSDIVSKWVYSEIN